MIYPIFLGNPRFSISGFCLVASFFWAGIAWGYSSGPPDGVAGDPPLYNNCTLCHTSFPVNSGDGTLQFTNLPSEYKPDSTYTLTINLSDPGQSRWGFEMTVIFSDGNQGGVLAPANPTMVQISQGPGNQRDYVKHTSLGTQVGHPSGTWDILWTSPPADSGPVDFYLAGNAANNSGTNSGDYIYAISASVPEQIVGIAENPPILPESHVLLSAFPNPFNPTISLNLSGAPAGQIRFEILNISGQTLRDFTTTGQETSELTLPLNLADLPSGSYFVRAVYPGGSVMVPIIKVK